ncbi:unnamed protein product [Choristocarpus tenellus]
MVGEMQRSLINGGKWKHVDYRGRKRPLEPSSIPRKPSLLGCLVYFFMRLSMTASSACPDTPLSYRIGHRMIPVTSSRRLLCWIKGMGEGRNYQDGLPNNGYGAAAVTSETNWGRLFGAVVTQSALIAGGIYMTGRQAGKSWIKHSGTSP